MRGLGPPEFVLFARRRQDLNELLWPAMASFRDSMDRWRRGDRSVVDQYTAPNRKDPFRFDARRAFCEEGRQRFEMALCRSVITSIAAEFEAFIDLFWKRMQADPSFSKHKRSDLFEESGLQQMLSKLGGNATSNHMMRKLFQKDLTAELARFPSQYSVHLVNLQSYFREIRNCIVHNGGIADRRLESSSGRLRQLAIEAMSFWHRHHFDVRYFRIGDRIEVEPRTTIAMLHFLNEYVEMLVAHLNNGRLGESVFDDRLGEAVDYAVEWVRRRGVTSARRLADDAFLARRVRQRLHDDGLKLPVTPDSEALMAQLVEAVRVRLTTDT